MKTDFFKFFHQRPEIKLNRKVLVFIVCLIISFFSWLQINLSKEHADVIPVTVEFVNLPKPRFGTTRISDNIMVEVEADGYSLLQYETKVVSFDFKKLKKDSEIGVYYFFPNNYTKSIAKQLGDNFKVMRALTDTIQLTPRLR